MKLIINGLFVALSILFVGNSVCSDTEDKEVNQRDIVEANVAKIKRYIARGERIVMPGADLSYADLQGLDLSDADFSNANFFGTKLQGANLSRADLNFAVMMYAKMKGTNFEGAQNMLPAIKDDARRQGAINVPL